MLQVSSRSVGFVPSYIKLCSETPKQSIKTGLILHGLMGHAGNWLAPAKKLLEQADSLDFGLELYLVHTRHHGDSTLNSFQPSGPNTISSCAQDLINLCDTELSCPPHFVIGHSLGGKIALEYAKQAFVPPSRVLCLDSFPSIIPPDFENNTPKGNVESISATELLQLPGKIPLPIKGEDWLKRYLLKKGYSLPLSIWLSKNIREKENSGEYEWKFNIKELPSIYESYTNLCMWDTLQHPPEGCSIDFLRGELSSRWTKETISEFEDRIKNTPNTSLIELKDAGHWMHVDNLYGLIDIILNSLSKI